MPQNETQAQDGDQFLDGIGETALVARYVLDGSLQDWSRNGVMATAEGGGHEFVDDDTFGTVLSLPGGPEGAFIRIPAATFGDATSFSICGWVKIREETPEQWFFDLGNDAAHQVGLVPMGAEREGGCSVRISSGGGKTRRGPASFRVRPRKWAHLAVVVDSASKTISLYSDGARVGSQNNFDTPLASLLGNKESDAAHLYLGNSLVEDGPRLGGKLYDVRLYRSALTDRQVAVIHHNALSDDELTGAEEGGPNSHRGYRKDRPRLLHTGLSGVDNIEVTTLVGTLPRLPRDIAGVYHNGSAGPSVRVIWPAPQDNSEVASPGSYKVIGKVPGTEFTPEATVRVVEAPRNPTGPAHTLRPFPLGQVVLTPDKNGEPTLFMRRRDAFLSGLAKTDPDRFLFVFRDAFGQTQPAGVRPLGVWDSQTTRLRGHATGHYLTALAQAYASTSYDLELHAEFAKKMNYTIGVLHQLSGMSGEPASNGGPSNADPATVPPSLGKSGFDSDLSKNGIRNDYWNWGEGFISGYPPDQFIMLEQGATYGGGNHQVWAPYYTLHKILAGLLDCYEVGGNEKSLEVASQMGLWVHQRLKRLPQKTRIRMWNSYIAGEYGGMNEVMARLYRVTEDERFLDTAKLFDNTRFFFGDAEHQHGLAKNVDTIRGRHANQHIPQILGALETYRAAREFPYYDVAINFWDICERSYMYSIGGVAGARNPNNAECFTTAPDTLFRNGLSDGGQNETCATYNLLKLARQLFMFDQNARYMDYYERAIYNHILASVDDDNPGNTYHVPLNPGARKSFGNARMNGFTCCNGTAIESGTKLQDSIYFTNAQNDALYVNLFVSSMLDWQTRGVGVTQSTNFPFADRSTLTVQGGGDFAIYVRVPAWANDRFAVRINNEEQDIEVTPGTYVKLQRQWTDGDAIELNLPMSFHLLPLMDQPNIASLFFGPVLLAAEESGARNTWRSVTLNVDNLGESLSGDRSKLHFQNGGAKLKPFFDFYDGFHSTYLNIEPEHIGSQGK
ncbi:beta-L-arabinofuranosidase domain-containing protein [Posidoniimonas polymericola]|nr:beta-L-arabinofuranosidase domain-containing protein [Posidoniimonas polymericola]